MAYAYITKKVEIVVAGSAVSAQAHIDTLGRELCDGAHTTGQLQV